VWPWLQEEDDKGREKAKKENKDAPSKEAFSFHVLPVDGP